MTLAHELPKLKPKDARDLFEACYDPRYWARHAIGATPSNQQDDVLLKYYKLLMSKMCLGTDYFNRRKTLNQHLKKYFDDYEELLLYSKKRGITWMAAKGIGKNACKVWIDSHFLTYHETCKIPCIMPSEKQLQTITWAEFKEWMDMKNGHGEYQCLVRDWFEIGSEFIYAREKDTGKRNQNSFMYQKTVIIDTDGKAKTLDGVHSPNLMVDIDEGSNVHPAVFKSLVNTLTKSNNFTIISFNPTENSGYAFDSHFREISSLYIQVQTSAEDSELVTKEHIEALKVEYRDKPDDYRIYVLGLPANKGKNSLISKQRLMDAQGYVFDDSMYSTILGLDPALTSDKAMVCVRKGPNIKRFVHLDHNNTLKLAQAFINLMIDEEAAVGVIEIDGLGRPIYDLIYAHCNQGEIMPVLMNGASDFDEEYYSKKEELLKKFSDLVEKNNLGVPNDYDFIEEMAAFEKDANNTSRTRRGFKAKGGHDFMLKKIGRSADKAHSALLTMEVDDSMYMLNGDAYDDDDDFESYSNKFGWMAA